MIKKIKLTKDLVTFTVYFQVKLVRPGGNEM